MKYDELRVLRDRCRESNIIASALYNNGEHGISVYGTLTRQDTKPLFTAYGYGYGSCLIERLIKSSQD